MTTLLETAFEKASALSDIEQNVFAKMFIAEIESEKRWDNAFSESEDLLSQMADSALGDLKDKKTTPLTQNQL